MCPQLLVLGTKNYVIKFQLVRMGWELLYCKGKDA